MFHFWRHLFTPSPVASRTQGPLQQGMRLLADGRHLAAFHVFDEMLFRGSPASAQALWLRGWCSLALGYTDDAVADCQAALRHDPHLGGAHLTLAHAHYQHNQLDAALHHLDQALHQGVPAGMAACSMQQLLGRVQQHPAAPHTQLQQALHIFTLNHDNQ